MGKRLLCAKQAARAGAYSSTVPVFCPQRDKGLASGERLPVSPRHRVILSLHSLFFICYSELWNRMYHPFHLGVPPRLVLSRSRFLYSGVCGRGLLLGKYNKVSEVSADEPSGKSELCKHRGVNVPVTTWH